MLGGGNSDLCFTRGVWGHAPPENLCFFSSFEVDSEATLESNLWS